MPYFLGLGDFEAVFLALGVFATYTGEACGLRGVVA